LAPVDWQGAGSTPAAFARHRSAHRADRGHMVRLAERILLD
jgi:hypothetical protein